MREVVFLADEHPMPLEDGLWSYQCCDFVEPCSVQELSLSGQPCSLLIVKLQAFVAVKFLEDSYFFLKILDNLLLMAVHPPS